MKREYKIIRCACCGQEITIPAELDEDYDKNDDPCCLDGNEFPNGAVANPWLGDFFCKKCNRLIVKEDKIAQEQNDDCEMTEEEKEIIDFELGEALEYRREMERKKEKIDDR